MNDLFLAIAIPATVIGVAFIVHWFEFRDRCRHKWGKWSAVESHHQSRVCEKCNLIERRAI